MPFFSDYGYYHHGPSVPFSSQYYSQLLQPHLHHGGGGGGGRSVPRVQPRNYNSIAVEQTLRAIRRGTGAATATTRHRFAAATPHRPVHINASEIDVTSPRRPPRRVPATPVDETADGVSGGGGIQRGRTVVRLHTVHKKAAAAATAADGGPPRAPPLLADAQPLGACMAPVPEEGGGGGGGVAKRGTIKRHTSVGIKVPVDVNDDRRPSAVTDEILREQEALFDTMIMEEMEGGGGGAGALKKPRRKSYPADVVDDGCGKKKPSKGVRKKSAADAALYGGDAERLTKKAAAAAAATANWKLNYDVIIEESGAEPPVSFTFKLNKAKRDGGGGGGNDGKQTVDANHNVVVGGASLHDDDDRRAGKVKKHAKVVSVKKPAAAAVNGDKNNNDKDNGRVGMLLSDPAQQQQQQDKAKMKVVVKKKVIKKKAEAGAPADAAPKSQPMPPKKQPTPKKKQPSPKQPQRPVKPPQTPSPPDSKSKKMKKKKASPTTAAAAATPAVITPFVRASFGKTFISPSQVSSTKRKFEKPKPEPEAKPEDAEPAASAEPTPEAAPVREPPDSSSSSSDDDDDDQDGDDTSSADDESSSVCSGNETTDSSTYYYSDDYGKRIACSVSSFDSGLPSSPVPAPDPIDCDVNCHRKCEKLMPNLCGVNQKLVVEALATLKRDSSSSSDTAANSYQIGGGTADGTERAIRSYSYRHHSRPKRIVPPATSIPRFRKYAVDDFNFLKVLGKGSFGKVLLAELKGTDYYYAVKCLKKDVVLEDDDVECTLIERKVLALGTNHPYLCHLFCTFQTESHLFFVMEYLNGGDLMFHIQQSGRFDEGRSRFYASEIVSGLKFLHKKGIVYRDLKLDNILLDFNGHVRIADFGMCKLQIYLDKTADTFCGTPDYMAPEIIKGQKYNQSVDWWSFGILLYEMLVGKSPFSGCDEDALFWSICNEQPQYPRYLSVDAKSVLVALLEKDASKRLGSLEANHSAEDVIRHPFFSSMDWCKLERRELEPPYMPRVYHPLDTHYFDKHFTKEKPRLTPVDKTILQSMDQSQFDGFTYTNPNVTDS